jgi:hypothetical protein
MYDCELDLTPLAPQQAPGTMLDARDVVVLSSLIRELRDLTQSRGSFAAASDFLRRLGAETESPRLVPADALDR